MKKFSLYLLCGAVALATFGCCSKSTVCIDINEGTGSDGGGTGTGSALVTFFASVESRNLTRSLSPVRQNVRAAVYAYPSTNADASGAPYAQGSYLSPSPGLLQGLNGFRMFLPNGEYNFYAVSDNTQFAGPAFLNGESDPLLNGIDYLWWGGLQQDVNGSQSGIPIVFQHCCTQVIFELEAGDGITINSLSLAHIYAPAEESKMTLATGVIAPATSFQTKESKMGTDKLMAQYTMIPFKIDAPLKVSFDVFVNGESIPRTYAVDVPVSMTGGEFRGGDSYRFKAVIGANEVTFPTVSVTNWVDVDETGKPLYPSEM